MDDIKYLVKFLDQLEYAQRLVNFGELYMRPAGYYMALENLSLSQNRQGDIFEGACSHKYGIAKGTNHPIYCMTQIEGKDIYIANGARAVNFSSAIFNDFFHDTKSGFAVVIRYNDFIERLSADVFNGYCCWYGSILYGTLAPDTLPYLLTNDSQKQLFVKRSAFDYQREFRLCFGASLSIEPDEILGSHFIAHIGNLADCAKIYSAEQFRKVSDDDYRLYLEE